MSEEQTPTPLLADADSTPGTVRRVPWFAAIALLLIAAVALGGLLYLTRQLIDRPVDDPPAFRVEPAEVGIQAAPTEPPFVESGAENSDAAVAPAGGSDDPSVTGSDISTPEAAAQPGDLAALREQVRGLSDRISALGSRFQERADLDQRLEQRIATLEQSLVQARQDQEALAQRVEKQEQRAAAPRPAPARTSGSPGAPGGRAMAAPAARLPFTVLGVEHWGGVAQVAISRASGTAWLAAGESLDGWQVLAIQGREVVWRAPAGQTVTQPIGGQ